MKIFMSGEIEVEFADTERRISNKVEEKIKNLIKDQDYGSAVTLLNIIPTIFSPKTLKALTYKERTRYSPKTGETDFRLRIDYSKFLKADDKGKEKLLLKNIIDSVRILNVKIKKGFLGEKLEQDILNLFGYNYEDLEKIN